MKIPGWSFFVPAILFGGIYVLLLWRDHRRAKLAHAQERAERKQHEPRVLQKRAKAKSLRGFQHQIGPVFIVKGGDGEKWDDYFLNRKRVSFGEQCMGEVFTAHRRGSNGGETKKD
ncbi:MAG: hypothetical protein Q8M83_04795 [bacterium]|nr:hypothetical protein [bacterium]